MTMQNWFNHYFLVFYPPFFAGMWFLTTYLVALIGGWRLLAQRFRFQSDFAGRRWRMQSARMRRFANYNTCLTIGADETGLFIVPIFAFRAWHPPLFIPWVEISVTRKKQLFLFTFVELRLGRSEQIPFMIRAKLAEELQAAAGPGWPSEQPSGFIAPPPPIG
jgi:hypothetical protein